MSKYIYKPLNAKRQEIRLLKLHPGTYSEPIRVSIVTQSFIIPRPPLISADRIERIQSGFPYGWYAYETLEGRVLFWNSVERSTSWDHPNPEYENKPHEYYVGYPFFEALSYTWGSSLDQRAIEILPSNEDANPNWKGEISNMFIRRNLHDAMQYLRSPSAPRMLWIDAISINQEDRAEQGNQVRRMKDIFKYARRVIAWIGLPSHNSLLALRKLGHLGNQVEYIKSYTVLPAPDCIEPEWYKAVDASCIDDDADTWCAVHDLLMRPWFRRLWVRLAA